MFTTHLKGTNLPPKLLPTITCAHQPVFMSTCQSDPNRSIFTPTVLPSDGHKHHELLLVIIITFVIITCHRLHHQHGDSDDGDLVPGHWEAVSGSLPWGQSVQASLLLRHCQPAPGTDEGKISPQTRPLSGGFLRNQGERAPGLRGRDGVGGLLGAHAWLWSFRALPS